MVFLDLGPRTDIEIEGRLRNKIAQERLTSIVSDMDADRIVTAADRDQFQQSVRAGRLQAPGRLGLADEIAPGRWVLADGIDDTLKRLGERSDIILGIQRSFAARGLERVAADYALFDPAMRPARPIVGRVVERSLSDEINDRHYLIDDGTDGRSHYVEIGKGEMAGIIPDRAIADIAAANGGRYSVDIRLRQDRCAAEAYAQTHVRRLEAMRRVMGNVECEPDGT